jgi:outer membrane protein TolC
VRSAFRRLGPAREALDAAAEGMKQAEEAVRQAGVRYRNGLIEELKLKEAMLGLALAGTDLAEARFELYRSMLDLQKAAGMVEVPAE